MLFGEGACTGEIVLASVAHLDVLADVVLVGDFGVAFHHSELFLVLASGDGGEVAALDLLLVEAVEEGEWDMFILLVGEGPIDPLLVLEFEVLQHTQVYLHC